MRRPICTVELHLDHETRAWWAHCDPCHFSAAADSMREIKQLVAEGHWGKYRLDLCVDNAPPVASATSTETVFEWTFR